MGEYWSHHTCPLWGPERSTWAQNQKWVPQASCLGCPRAGPVATSPVPSLGTPLIRRGTTSKMACSTMLSQGPKMQATLLHQPWCLKTRNAHLGDTQMACNHRWRMSGHKAYITQALSQAPNVDRGDEHEYAPTLPSQGLTTSYIIPTLSQGSPRLSVGHES